MNAEVSIADAVRGGEKRAEDVEMRLEPSPKVPPKSPCIRHDENGVITRTKVDQTVELSDDDDNEEEESDDDKDEELPEISSKAPIPDDRPRSEASLGLNDGSGSHVTFA